MLWNRTRYCIEALAAVGCLDPGRKSSGIILGLGLTVSDNADICAYITGNLVTLSALTMQFSRSLHCVDSGSPLARGSIALRCCLLCPADEVEGKQGAIRDAHCCQSDKFVVRFQTFEDTCRYSE